MSNSTQACVFLPTYILEHVVNNFSSRIDSDSFLRKATSEQLLDVILAFYPHFCFTEKAKEDHELLQMIFTEMVAFRLSTLVAPIKSDTTYFRIHLKNQPEELQDSIKVVDSKDDINSARLEMFNTCCFSYLEIGQLHIAAQNLKKFTNTYQFLTQEEIRRIEGACPDTEARMQKSLVQLMQTYQLVEEIQLDLLDCSLATIQHKELDDRLKIATNELTSQQGEFSKIVEDGALFAALIQHHQ
ncbi:hypothetical protein DFH28DRAFT_885761 [Melampsora americana]|nr:hypothetical protein DFH28DRAFT_885761 [Melampsora americana]